MHNMDYKLNTEENKAGTEERKHDLANAWGSIAPLLRGEGKNLSIAFVAVFITSAANLLAPVLIAHVIDTAIGAHDFASVLRYSAFLLAVYILGLAAQYLQTIRMGTVGRGVLFKLRNALFGKLSELPIAFFNANKSGDLISRINNDTDKLNQFFAQALMQFIGNFFIILGAGILLLALNWRLGIAALLPALFVLGATQLLGPWVKRTSREGLAALGSMSAEVQESLANFKVIVAFNRLDYFREKFAQANERNYRANIRAGVASNLFAPLYTLAANVAQLAVLGFGVYLISHGELTIGLLIGYLLYVTNFYNPLRQLASVWSSFQTALASLDRVGDVLALENNLPVLPELGVVGRQGSALLAFSDVSFAYVPEKPILHDVSFSLEQGKTYALVGPTGGGKTTTASLMARLFDPSSGTILLSGRDIRSYTPEERAQKIGFILQEPFLWSGTVAENIAYGNAELAALTPGELHERIEQAGLAKLIERFSEGLTTSVSSGSASISLGQRQLVAFMRAVLRKPDILILDEATANIDTVTEQSLEEVLEALPAMTTKVIIAHRLNTIENADTIFFVNGGTVTEAGSMEHAVEMLLHNKRSS